MQKPVLLSLPVMKSGKRYWSQPYLIWLTAALALIIVAFPVDGSLDIHLHDTYFVIAHTHVFLAIAGLLLVFALLYKILERVLFSGWLNGLHLVFTLLPLIVFLFPLSYRGIAGSPRRYYDSGAWATYRSFGTLNSAVSLAVIFLFFAQVLFLVHILWGLVRLFSRRR